MQHGKQLLAMGSRLALGLLVVALAVGVLSSPAAMSQQGNNLVVSSPGVRAAADINAVVAYWTEERMRAAQPMPLPELDGSSASVGARAAVADETGRVTIGTSGKPGDRTEIRNIKRKKWNAIAAAAEAEPVWGTYRYVYTRYRLFPDTVDQYKTFPYRLVGKLFFTKPSGGNFVCSGAVVTAANKSVIMTAGHCVYDTAAGGGWVTNVVFVPARRNGVNPYGIWTAQLLVSASDWTSNANFESDYGAIVANRGGNHNLKIGNQIGWLGIVFNVSRKQHWHLHGYPAAARDLNTTPPGAQFDGEHHEICAAPWATNNTDAGTHARTIGVGCDKTGGTSGGPWLLQFSGVGGATNLINGVNSHRWGGGPPNNLRLYTPFYGTLAKAIWKFARATPVP